MDIVTEIAKKAKAAAPVIAAACTGRKNRLLADIARALEKNISSIIAENKKDMERCQKEGIPDNQGNPGI